MRSLIVVAVASLVAGSVAAQSACKVEGVWQLVSGSEDGKPYPAGTRNLKIITKTHFAAFWQNPGGPKEMKSVADSLAAFRVAGAVGGTYTLQGTTYTERLDYFPDPAYVGKALAFTCRTEGDRFHQSGNFPVFASGKKVRDIKLEEVWKRVE
jgi:hypothetical protein